MQRLGTLENHLKTQWLLTYNKVPDLKSIGNLKDKVILVSGGSRGIGLAIAKKCAQDGAKIAILGKTADPHRHLPGTIYSAVEEVNMMGGQGLAIQCDIRFEDQIQAAVHRVVEQFGGLDILINCASAIALSPLEDLTTKKYDLMNNINARGTYLMTRHCICHLKASENGHVLNISPPLVMESDYFSQHPAYTIAKYAMSMHVLGLSKKYQNIVAFNALWPRTVIATAAVEFELGGKEMMKMGRTPLIMADAAYKVLTSSKRNSGNFFFDDELLGDVNLSKYKVDPDYLDKDLLPDFFY